MENIAIEDNFCLEDVEKDFKSIVKKIEKNLNEIRERESKWDAISKRIEIAAGRAEKRIKLDVGGRIFSVSKETLLSIENSYFYGLVANSDKFKPLDDGTFFIERNPLVFDRILDYLRTGILQTLELSPYQMKMLMDDLDYYCIPLPRELQHTPVQWDVTKKPQNCTLTANNTTATKLTALEWDCGIIGNKAVDRYTIKIDNRGTSGCIMIGFSTGATWNPNGSNYTTNGWFIYANTGSLFGGNLRNGRYSTAINNGDHITVIREGASIRFEKNKVNLGICSFTTVPNHPLFPAVDLCDSSTVTLVNEESDDELPKLKRSKF